MPSDLELDSLNAVKPLLCKQSLHFYAILPVRGVQAAIHRKELSGHPMASAIGMTGGFIA